MTPFIMMKKIFLIFLLLCFGKANACFEDVTLDLSKYPTSNEFYDAAKRFMAKPINSLTIYYSFGDIKVKHNLNYQPKEKLTFTVSNELALDDKENKYVCDASILYNIDFIKGNKGFREHPPEQLIKSSRFCQRF